MEGFQSKFSNSETHQILDCSTNLKTPQKGYNNVCILLASSNIEYEHLFSIGIKKIETVGKILDSKLKQL